MGYITASFKEACFALGQILLSYLKILTRKRPYLRLLHSLLSFPLGVTYFFITWSLLGLGSIFIIIGIGMFFYFLMSIFLQFMAKTEVFLGRKLLRVKIKSLASPLYGDSGGDDDDDGGDVSSLAAVAFAASSPDLPQLWHIYETRNNMAEQPVFAGASYPPPPSYGTVPYPTSRDRTHTTGAISSPSLAYQYEASQHVQINSQKLLSRGRSRSSIGWFDSRSSDNDDDEDENDDKDKDNHSIDPRFSNYGSRDGEHYFRGRAYSRDTLDDDIYYEPDQFYDSSRKKRVMESLSTCLCCRGDIGDRCYSMWNTMKSYIFSAETGFALLYSVVKLPVSLLVSLGALSLSVVPLFFIASPFIHLAISVTAEQSGDTSETSSSSGHHPLLEWLSSQPVIGWYLGHWIPTIVMAILSILLIPGFLYSIDRISRPSQDALLIISDES
eukprot:gb/GECH01002078.1/.p1 GENE.gb/GECH01002078.1/~~gb/GECH01002078.1/.p1  ORF type:complete len:442 (+),score=81.31 gb/GECH01002078.1/:1-1326(+)